MIVPHILNMKKLFYMLVFLSFQTIFSQSAFESSKTISEHLKKNKIELVLQHRNLMWTDAENTNYYWQKLENFSVFLNDPFNPNLQPIDVSEILHILQSAEPIVMGEYQPTKSGDNYELKEIEKFLESVENIEAQSKSTALTGGVSFTTRLIDGTSKFLVNRTKRELSISFYEQFYHKLNEPLYYKLAQDSVQVYLKDVLPNAYMLFDSKRVFETPSFGQTWTTAFQNDLIQLPFSLLEVFQKDDTFVENDLGRYALMLYNGLQKIENGNHPIEIIENLAADFSQTTRYETDAHLGLLNLISRNCTTVDETSRKWVNLIEFSKLNKEEKKYFTGLIYQQGIQEGLFKGTSTSQKPLNVIINDDNYLQLYQGIKEIQQELIHISDLLETEQAKKETITDYTAYSGLFVNAVQLTYQTMLQVKQSNYYQSDYYTHYIPVSKDIVSFYESIDQSNYGGCLLSTLNFLNHLSHQNDNKRFIQDVTYYGNFLVDVVFASTHEDVDMESIISKYALPVTSYRVKHMYRRSIDICAYPGLYAGYEFSASKSPNFGVTAPLGFAFSWSKKNKEETYSPSHSLFISALDLGAPFSYRFVNDAAEGLPENITWEQIFSPGVLYVYGFKNTPLALSTGIQYTPLLRKIETQNILDDENVLRISMALTVDIPIFNLYKKK
jgi:hypothetical protein